MAGSTGAPRTGTRLQWIKRWRNLSRRARRFESETEFAQYAIARSLPKEALHPRIATTVWMAFMRGEFDVAVFQAMKAVEVSVREAAEAAGLPTGLLGVPLMRKAFDPEVGPLTDTTAEKGEREARSALENRGHVATRRYRRVAPWRGR